MPEGPRGAVQAPHSAFERLAGRLGITSHAGLLAAWALALLLLALLGLGQVPLFDVDEGAFSEATREMLQSGDWGHTTLNGEPRWDKPILTYWLQAASVALFGLNEAALRLPSALAGWAWAVALMVFASQRWNVVAGLAAAGMLASSVGVIVIGRAATADALLNLWLALAMLDLWRHIEAEAAPAGRRALRRAAVWMALGCLTKGPVALLIPAATVLLWTLMPGAGRRRTFLAGLLGDPAAWALLLGLALPWYGYALARYGWEFVDGFLLKHNLRRYGGTLEGHGGGLGYYLVVLPLMLLPWTPLLVAAAARLRGRWSQDLLTRWLVAWAGFVFVFFSLSGTKLPHYVLYGCSPLVLLAARELAARLQDEPGAIHPRWVDGMLLLLALWPWLGVAAAYGLQPRFTAAAGDPYFRALLTAAPPPAWPLALSAALVGLGMTGVAIGVGIGTRRPPPPRSGSGWARALTRASAAAPWRLAALGAGVLLTLGQQVLVQLPWWGERLQGHVRHAATAAHAAWRQDPGGWLPNAVQWGLHQPSFAVYLGQEAPRRAPRPGELALVRRDRLDRLARALLAEEARAAEPAGAGSRSPDAPDLTAAWQVLHEEKGLVLLRWRGRLQARGAAVPGPTAAQEAPAAAASGPQSGGRLDLEVGHRDPAGGLRPPVPELTGRWG